MSKKKVIGYLIIILLCMGLSVFLVLQIGFKGLFFVIGCTAVIYWLLTTAIDLIHD